MENKEVNKEAKKNRFESDVERALWREKTAVACKEELLKNEKVKQMYVDFSKHSVDSFVEYYTGKKVQTLEWGDKYIEWRNKRIEDWLEKGVKKLREIQQKKLFDLQCQWRANKIKLKGIALTTDFLEWEMDVFNCPFLPAITDDELQMYMDYLNSDEFYEKPMFDFSFWQHYDWIKDAYNNEESEHIYPPWYAFYDSRKGSSVFLSFPDIRGEKERFYYSLGKDEYDRVNAKKIKQQVEVHKQKVASRDTRQDLNCLQQGLIEWFVEKYEDEATKEVFNISGRRFIDEDKDELNINDWPQKQMLEAAEGNVPMKEWRDWKEAISITAWNHSKKRIAESLPEAYEQYKLMEEMGWGGNDIFSQMMEMGNKQIKEENIRLIKRGRVLNGESGDLDF